MTRVALLLALLLGGFSVFADQVTIEWRALAGAHGYELEVSQQSRVVFDQVFPSTKTRWTGDLPFGQYTYRIRGLSRSGKRGMWSDPRPFLVTPAAPQLLLPPSGSEVIPSGTEAVTLKWSPVAGVRRFLVAVRGENVPRLQRIVAANQAALPLGPGRYSWQVTPILESHTGASGAVQAQVLKLKASEVWTFSVGTASPPEDERGKVAVGAGILTGFSYFFPYVGTEVSLGRRFALGARLSYANNNSADVSLKLYGVGATLGFYPGPRRFAGLFAQTGFGLNWFRGETGGQSESPPPSASGFLLGGWRWRQSGGGLSVAISAGTMYVSPPSLTLLTTRIHDWLALAGLEVGYVFP